jgi:hypothetical protein
VLQPFQRPEPLKKVEKLQLRSGPDAKPHPADAPTPWLEIAHRRPPERASNSPPRIRSTTTVGTGPYRVTRNPIYLGILGLIALAIDPQQPLTVADAGALRPRHPLRCSRPRGSLSRAELRRCLPLPRARAALTVLPAKMVPSQGALQHSAKDGFPPAATGLLRDTQI